MITPLQISTEDFLTACLAYCLTWELAGTRAPEHWDKIRDYVRSGGYIVERQQWTTELYEEAPATAQEERSILARVETLIVRPQDIGRFRDRVLALLPEPMRQSAAGHSLLRRVAVPTDHSKLKAWLVARTPRRFPPLSQSFPLGEREVEFDRFLELPYFLEAFRKFWEVPPKYRNNRQTRALICIGAVLSHSIPAPETGNIEKWSTRLADTCHYSPQTQEDLFVLIDAMSGFSYDTQELAYHLSVDAKSVDNENLRTFIRRHSDELTDFASEFVRDVELCSL